MPEGAPAPADATPTRIKIVWGLYIASLVVGLTGLIGVILAHVWRRKAAGHPLASHFDRQVRTFWTWLGLSFLGVITLFLYVGLLILGAALLYLAVVSVIGLMKAIDGQPWP